MDDRWTLERCKKFMNGYSFEETGGISVEWIVRAEKYLDEDLDIKIVVYGYGDTVEEAEQDVMRRAREYGLKHTKLDITFDYDIIATSETAPFLPHEYDNTNHCIHCGERWSAANPKAA